MLPPLGNRWLHVQGVAERARWVSQILNETDRDYLLAAAWAHDLGYAPELKKTGFHPLDGANYICETYGDQRLACLVAHHSEARFEGDLRGFASELSRFPRERSALADALIYCDMTTNSRGDQVTLKERLADIFQRYPETDLVAQAIRQARPYYALALARTHSRLRQKDVL
jgi:hypothetical protein